MNHKFLAATFWDFFFTQISVGLSLFGKNWELFQFSQKVTARNTNLKTYNKHIKIYEKTMTKLETDPYDITIEKIKVFITFEKDEGLELKV